VRVVGILQPIFDQVPENVVVQNYYYCGENADLEMSATIPQNRADRVRGKKHLCLFSGVQNEIPVGLSLFESITGSLDDPNGITRRPQSDSDLDADRARLWGKLEPGTVVSLLGVSDPGEYQTLAVTRTLRVFFAIVHSTGEEQQPGTQQSQACRFWGGNWGLMMTMMIVVVPICPHGHGPQQQYGQEPTDSFK
jgi:hypothetical protein